MIACLTRYSGHCVRSAARRARAAGAYAYMPAFRAGSDVMKLTPLLLLSVVALVREAAAHGTAHCTRPNGR